MYDLTLSPIFSSSFKNLSATAPSAPPPHPPLSQHNSSLRNFSSHNNTLFDSIRVLIEILLWIFHFK
jgi:hypothetical protein